MESLADFLGVDPTPGATAPERLEDITDAKAFGQAVVNSLEFRRYILIGLTLGTLPGFASILGRLMDHALGKPVDRVEHTGKDGQPIETITEVRRVIIRTAPPEPLDEEQPHQAVH